MISFRELTEDKGGKNLHLEHLEDEIINYGVDGGRAAINFLRSLRDMLAGATRSSVNMTVKWDGALPYLRELIPKMINSLSQRNLYSTSVLNFTRQMQKLMLICLVLLLENLK